VSATLAIGIGTDGDDGELIALAVKRSPGQAAHVTVLAFQRNVKGLGWRLGKPRYLLIGFALPLVECSLVYGLAWLTGLGGLQGDVTAAAETLVTITPVHEFRYLAQPGRTIEYGFTIANRGPLPSGWNK
jgi:hypothetical protein